MPDGTRPGRSRRPQTDWEAAARLWNIGLTGLPGCRAHRRGQPGCFDCLDAFWRATRPGEALCPVCETPHDTSRALTMECAWAMLATRLDDLLLAVLDSLPPAIRGSRLLTDARARWAARHDPMRRFMD